MSTLLPRAALCAAVLTTCAGATLGQNVGAAPEHASSVAAQAGRPPAQEQAAADRRPGTDFMVTLFGTHAFESDFTDVAGSVSVSRVGAEIAARRPIDERSRLSVSLGAELSAYEFSTPSAFGASTAEPWNEVAQLSLSAIYSRQATQQWGWFFGAGVSTAAETDGDFGRAFTGGLVAGVNYAVNENLSIGGGFVARSVLEDSGSFFPLVSVDWKINDQWRIANINEFNSNGVALTYTPSQAFEVSLRAAYQSRAFRLAEDGPVPHGVGRDSRIPVWLQARYNFNPRASASLAAGYAFFQEFTIDDQDGNELDQQDVEAAPFIAGGFSFAF